MIVGMWHGRVPASKAAAYREFLNKRAIPDYRAVDGNMAVYVLERREGEITHFITLTFWENMEVIKRFAGNIPKGPSTIPRTGSSCWSLNPGWSITR